MLNALRHQWFGRGGGGDAALLSDEATECSTPCGISGLAGSIMSSKHTTPPVLNAPCGISGLAGAMPNITDQIRGVSCSTPCGISGLAGAFFCAHYPLDSSRAQRLAASVVWQAAGHGAKDLKSRCSTPCGISGLAGAGRSVTHALYRVVLNALRHQWFGRAPGGGWLLHRPGCAQRLCGISGLAGLEAVEKRCRKCLCSTPCGISGLGRQSQLNKLAESGSCSTPCGISGLAGPKGR